MRRGGDLRVPHGISERRYHLVHAAVDALFIPVYGVALRGHFRRAFFHRGGVRKCRKIEIHRHFGRRLAVAEREHPLIKRYILRYAGHVVVPVAVRSGDDPRQTQGIEKRNGGHALSLRAEGILHSAEQQRGILRRVARLIKQHAAHIAAHRALRERIARAARGKAAKRALFFEHERALAAEGRVREQQFVQFTGVERRIPRRRARGIPQTQNLRRVRALIQTKLHKTLRISQKGCCVSQQPFVEIFCQPLTAPIVTPSRKYFCNVKNRMNIGSAESVAPAIMGAKSVSFANLKVLRPTWIVNI